MVKFEDNSAETLRELDGAIPRILLSWGLAIQNWASEKCRVGTPESTKKKGYVGGTLRNSITFEVNEGEQSVSVGSNVEYAP